MSQLDKSEILAENLAMQNSGEETWSLTWLCLTSLKLLYRGRVSFAYFETKTQDFFFSTFTAWNVLTIKMGFV